MRRAAFLASPALALMLLVACGDGDGDDPDPLPSPTASSLPTPAPTPTPSPTPTPTTTAVTRTAISTFDNPWAMVFLPDGNMLVTEKGGRLYRLAQDGGGKVQVSGVPDVRFSGQIGLHDVILDPNFASNAGVWISYMEPTANGTSRLAVARATLTTGGAPRLDGLNVVWRSTTPTTGGHPGARLAFSPAGLLHISLGERQQGSPAQDLGSTLGKIVRINPDGTPAAGNPFASTSGARAEIFSLGQRNPYGLVFARDGRLFESEQGPEGGDEFNLIESGRNYGWDAVSEGSRYGGAPYPRHSSDPRFTAPLVTWTPVIAPGGMIQYSGTRFSGWDGDFILAGLASQGIVRVRVSGSTASEVGRIALGARIREVEQGPNGSLWVLEDGSTGRLVRIDPA